MKVLEKQNRLDALFEKKSSEILAVYFTAGFPQLTDTLQVGQLLAQAGVDIIEIGIPFSDPVADGPVIQSSNKKALDNGMTLQTLLEQSAHLRKLVDTPIILMGYLNPILQYGVESFCKAASLAGVDGIIIPDLPLIEFQEVYRRWFELYGLHNIFLVSPSTSEDRIRQIDQLSSSFIYAVSSSSTTGSKNEFTEDQINYFKRLQGLNLMHPALIGFGIHNADTFQSASKYAKGAIVGSAFISMLAKSKEWEQDIPAFVKLLRGGQ